MKHFLQKNFTISLIIDYSKQSSAPPTTVYQSLKMDVSVTNSNIILLESVLSSKITTAL